MRGLHIDTVDENGSQSEFGDLCVPGGCIGEIVDESTIFLRGANGGRDHGSQILPRFSKVVGHETAATGGFGDDSGGDVGVVGDEIFIFVVVDDGVDAMAVEVAEFAL